MVEKSSFVWAGVLVFLLQTQVFAQFTVQNAKVEYVIDGDTFITIINNKQDKVRMKCIDAPEINHKGMVGFDDREGRKSREYLMGLFLRMDSTVKLKCNDERDKYGRVVCDVFGRDGESINLSMVKERYAKAMPYYCSSGFDGMRYVWWELVGG